MSANTVRIAAATDAAAIHGIYAPVVAHSAISFELEPPTVEEMAQRIEATLPQCPYLVAEREGEVVGYVYASQHREREAYQWSVDVTVYVAPEAHRSGVARTLYGSLLPILETQGFHTAYAGIALPNKGSIGLHEALGFKHDKWHDVGYWCRKLSQSNSPRPVVHFSTLRTNYGPIR